MLSYKNDTAIHVISRLWIPKWEKVWSWLSAQLQPFFRLLVRILTMFDKKLCILTCRDKRESYLIFFNQTMFRYAKNVRLAYFWLSVTPTLAITGSHCHSLAYSGPLWLNIAL